MKNKKQKQPINEMEKGSSEEEIDLMEAYVDRPVQGQVRTSFFGV